MAILNPNQPGQEGQSSGANQTNNQPGQPLQQVQGAGQQSGAVTPVNTGGTSQSGAQPSGGGSTPQTVQSYNPNTQQGSGYTNIQNIIKANQGNQLGQDVGQNLQSNVSGAQANLQNAQNQFNQQTQANQSNTQANQQLAQNVLSNPTAYASFGTNSPTQANQQAANQFQTLLSGQYQGPTNLQNSTQLQNQAANAQQQAQALGSTAGQIGLLQQMYGNPNYSTGEQNLDALLLGQSKAPSLQNANQQAAVLNNNVNNAITGAQNQGAQAASQAQQFGTALQNQIGSNVGSLQNTLQGQAQSAQTANNQQYQQALSDLQSGNVSQQEANLLGLTQNENVYNLFSNQGSNANSAGASAFLQENPQQATAQNDANAQQYAQMQALNQLAGQYIPSSAQAITSQYTNPSQAGSYQSQQNILANQGAFNTALNAASTNYNSQLQPAEQTYQAAQAQNNLVNNINYYQQQYQATGNPQDWQNYLQASAQYNATNPIGAGGSQVNFDNTQAAYALAANNLNNVQNSLNAAYGNPEMINIQGSNGTNYPAIGGLIPNKAPAGQV